MNLRKQTEKCADLVLPALNEGRQKEYVEALKELIPLVEAAAEEEMDSLPFGVNVISSFHTDQLMMEKAVKEEKDRVSMLSTLITYIECQREGLPQHSKVYMDRVTALRHKIDDYYGEVSQQFCGS